MGNGASVQAQQRPASEPTGEIEPIFHSPKVRRASGTGVAARKAKRKENQRLYGDATTDGPDPEFAMAYHEAEPEASAAQSEVNSALLAMNDEKERNKALKGAATRSWLP